ncbi:MAG TPA: hypothetical protein VLB69_00875, partial [Rudaea sp.]|nr:hypothetical protein [Rudaea sp.]
RMPEVREVRENQKIHHEDTKDTKDTKVQEERSGMPSRPNTELSRDGSPSRGMMTKERTWSSGWAGTKRRSTLKQTDDAIGKRLGSFFLLHFFSS